METYKHLKDLLVSADKDATAFYEKGNKVAGTRLRLALQQIKITATTIRQEIAEKKKGK